MTNECIHGLFRQKMYTRTVVESYQQWPEMGYECAKYSIFYQVYNTQESSVVKCVAKKIKYYALFEPRHNWHRCTHHIRMLAWFACNTAGNNAWYLALIIIQHDSESRKYPAVKEVLQ